MELSENSLKILTDRYLDKDEAPEELFKRVARVVSLGDLNLEKLFYEMMINFHFLPNTPTLINAGRYTGQLSACFTLPVGDNIGNIFDSIKNAALIHVSGGGTGFDFSELRPKGSKVSNSSGESSGPISFMKIFDAATNELKQGGVRKGACIGTLRVDHPDIEEFISVKNDEGLLSNFNISVAITNKFMEALENNEEEFELIFGGKVYKTINPRKLWGSIVESSWLNGEPGVVFIDRINDLNVLNEIETISAVNPCVIGNSPILTKYGIKYIKDARVGDAIWSAEGWTTITNFQYSGIKNTYRYTTNAGIFRGTEKHKIVENGKKVEVELAKGIDKLRGFCDPNFSYKDADLQDVVDGLVLGDGMVNHTHKQLDGNYQCNHVRLCIGENDYDYFDSKIKDFIGDVYSDGIQYRVKTTLDHSEIPRTFKRKVPKRFKHGSFRKVCGFLRGIYTANGYVVKSSKGVGIQLTSKRMINDIQVMLSSVGISAGRMVRKKVEVEHRNGTYVSRKSYVLNIYKDRNLFQRLIGFIQEYKTDILNEICKTNGSGREKVTYEINETKYLGRKKVYDITVDNKSRTFWSGGLSIGNCGEQPLPSYGSCVLGSINLSKFVNEKGHTLYNDLRETINLGITFLDNIVDITTYTLPKIEIESKSKRRIGLGIMGFADYLIKKKIRYGSAKSLIEVKTLMSFFKNTAYECSIKLGMEKGVPPLLKENGINRRNGLLTTIAPTGSLSLIAGCSSGCEPIFSFNYEKSCIDTTINVTDDSVDLSNKEDYMVSALEISPEEHVNVLAAFQKYIDAGISKTVNLPNSASREDVSHILTKSYKLGCKAVSLYRSGSRKFEALIDKTEESKKSNVSLQQTNFPSPSMRPNILEGFTRKIRTGPGNLYVTINELNDIPFEIFLKVGKSGGENSAYSEAIGRLASLCLRSGINVTDIVKTLQNISGSEFVWDDGKLIRSVPDALSRVLVDRYKILASQKSQKLELDGLLTCPDCKGSDLVVEEGCVKCYKCGWSKCK